ncbi:hypothetical protein N7535_005472 [Penicillium sp. DV-2018c]|nr:hypothetical protein N7535_005472 [Penicillium sp. DV-2018c]
MDTRSRTKGLGKTTPLEGTQTPATQDRDDALPRPRSTSAPVSSPASASQRSKFYLRTNEGKLIQVTDIGSVQDWIEDDPQNAWDYLGEVLRHRTLLRERNEDLENKCQELVQQNQELETIVEELEKLPPSEEIEKLYHENRKLTKEVKQLRAQSNDSQHPPSSTGSRRSAKLPDAPIMDDGVSVKFTAWRREIENKLLLNDDYYPTEKHRMAYVMNRCAGKAQAQLQPRLEPDAKNQYRTAEEMLEHLQLVFRDPQQRRIALREYGELKMKVNEDFNTFYAEFSRLALESKRDEELQKDDLFEKLPYRLQTLVAGEVYKDDVTMQDFVDSCRRGAITVTRMQPSNRFRKSESSTFQPGNKGSSTSNKRTSTTPAVNSRGKTNTTFAERQALLKEGKCFNCRKEGHLSRDCPEGETEDKNKTKTSATSAKKRGQSTEQRIKDAESDPASDSGKD